MESPKLPTTRKDYIIAGTLVISIIVVFILIGTVFKKSNNTEVDGYLKALEAKNETVQVLEHERGVIMDLHDQFVKSAQERLKQDSTLQQQLIANQANYKPLNKRYEQIPEHIARLGNNTDSIRAAFAGY